MAVIDRLRRFALARPHLLVIEGRGGTATRLAVDWWSRERGWPVALSPRDADLVVLCGQVPPRLDEAVGRVLPQVPFPREIVRLGKGRDIGAQLEEAAGRLVDWPRQRAAAERALREQAVDFRHGDVTGWLGSNRGEGPPAGLTLAYRAEDRDDLTLDVLHVPMGPIIPGWPAGLRLRTRLQGDVVQAADADADAFLGLGAQPGSFWDVPFEAALAGGSVTVGEAERRRAASHLDSLARFVFVAGDETLATRVARLRDAVLDGEPTDAARDGLSWLRRRLVRWRLLDRLTADVAPLSRERAVRDDVSGPALRACGIEDDIRSGSDAYPSLEPVVAVGDGDTRSRWHQWLAEADQALALVGSDRLLVPVDGWVEGPRGRLHASPLVEPPTARVLWVVEDLVLGEVWSNVRYIVASFDPDAHQLAAWVDARRAALPPEPAGV